MGPEMRPASDDTLTILPLAARPHAGQGRPHHPDLPDDVRVELAQHLVVLEFLDGAVEAVAGVVEHGVDVAVRALGQGHGRIDAGAVRDVARRHRDAVAPSARAGQQAGPVAVRAAHRRDDAMAALHELQRRRLAEAARRARDEHHLILQDHVGPSFWL